MANVGAAPVVPIFSHWDVHVCMMAAKACYLGGLRVFEFLVKDNVSYNIFCELNQRLAVECPEMALGVGGIIDAETATKYIQAGANFICGPILNEEIVRLCNCRGVLYAPGCMTPTEIARAQELGCELIMLFPADALRPSLLRSIMTSMPWSRILVSGGVAADKDNLRQWFEAGAFAVGIGSQVFLNELISTGNWPTIEAKCREALRIIKGK